jgi:hypothetical protein
MIRKKKKKSFTKRVCRLTTYATSIMMFTGGLVLFIVGVYFVAVFQRELPHSFINAKATAGDSVASAHSLALTPACECLATWEDAVCLVVGVQQGCPSRACDGNDHSWCSVANPVCATAQDAGHNSRSAWSFCNASTPVNAAAGGTRSRMPPFVVAPVIMGVFLMLISAVGFAGAKYYSRLMLGFYVVSVAAILITQFVLVILIFVRPSSVSHGFGFEDEQSAILSNLFAESQSAIAISFTVLIFVEAFVICSSMCLAREITGDELLNKSWMDLEAQAAETSAKREKEMMAFEMQARKLVSQGLERQGLW